ncbi:MAG: PDZ domain-containing protein, partial [Holosporales bacterium]|nr:PDZ domain-containing protein [Holosporales bacterium]
SDKAGIKRGDIILKFNGIRISEKNSLQKIVGNTKIDSAATVKIWRQKDGKDWKEIELEVKVGDFEKAVESGLVSLDNGSENAMVDKEDEEEEVAELAISVSKIPERMKKKIAQEFADNVIVTRIDETRSAAFFEPPFRPKDIIVSANNTEVHSPKELKKIINKVKNDSAKNRKPVPFVVIRNNSMVMIATTLNLSDEKSEKKEKKDSDKEKSSNRRSKDIFGDEDSKE